MCNNCGSSCEKRCCCLPRCPDPCVPCVPSPCPPRPRPCPPRPQPRERCIPYITENFGSIVTPLNNLVSQSGNIGSIEIHVTQIGSTVTFQWEGFTGVLSATGVAYLTINQTVPYFGSGTFTFPIILTHAGTQKVGYLYISSSSSNIQARIYLNEDGSTTGVNVGDAIQVNSGSVSWIL